MKKTIFNLIIALAVFTTSALAQDAWIIYYQGVNANGSPEGTRSVRFVTQEELVEFATVTIPSMTGAKTYKDADDNIVGIHAVTFQTFLITSTGETVVEGDWVPTLIEGTEGYLIIWTENGVEKSEVFDKAAAEAKRLEIINDDTQEMVYDEAMYTQKYSLNKEPDTVVDGSTVVEIIE